MGFGNHNCWTEGCKNKTQVGERYCAGCMAPPPASSLRFHADTAERLAGTDIPTPHLLKEILLNQALILRVLAAWLKEKETKPDETCRKCGEPASPKGGVLCDRCDAEVEAQIEGQEDPR